MAAFSLMLKTSWNVDEDLCFTSGLNAEELGKWRSQFGSKSVTIIEIDHSRYDAHQGCDSHKCEYDFYCAAGIQDHPDAAFVFNRQSRTIGFTAHGVKYKVPYTRKSGDPNTSCGNSIINGMVTKFVLHTLNLDNNKMLVQGDDNLVVIEQQFSPRKRRELEREIKTIMLSLGFEVKLKITTQWYDCEFCSSLFWPVSDGFVLGPKIGRRLPKMGFSLTRLNKGQVKGMLLGAVKECKFVPILRVYSKYCLKQLKTVKKTSYYDYSYRYKSLVSESHDFNEDTEQFFYDRYGVTVCDMEASLVAVLKDVREFTTMLDWPDLEILLACDL